MSAMVKFLQQQRPALSAASSAVSDAAGLIGQEIDCLAPMHPRRQVTFAAGRRAARQAMTNHGWPTTAVLRGEAGEPQWPPGVVGSITHTDRLALAVCGASTHWLGVGVDLTENTPVEPETANAICQPEDPQGPIRISQSISCDGAMLTFAAKEAVYKCLYPCHFELFDFPQAHIELLSPCQFRVRLSSELRSAQHADAIVGQLFVDRTNILALATIAR